MNSSQRWVAIVAFGAGCWVTAAAVNSWLDGRGTDGWFNYAPNNGVAFSPVPGGPWRGLLVWLIAIVVWFGASYLMLRRAEER